MVSLAVVRPGRIGVRGDPDAAGPDDGEADHAARTPCAPTAPLGKEIGMATIEKVATYEAPGHTGSPVDLMPPLRQLHRRAMGSPVKGEYKRI